MGRILIDTRDIRDAARDLRGGVGAISEARANVNSVFRGSWLGPNGAGFESRWGQELAVISQVGGDVERIAGDLDAYASRVDSEQRLGSQIRGVAGWTLRTGKSLFSRVWNALKAGWNSIMSFLTRISKLISEAMAFLLIGKFGDPIKWFSINWRTPLNLIRGDGWNRRYEAFYDLIKSRFPVVGLWGTAVRMAADLVVVGVETYKWMSYNGWSGRAPTDEETRNVEKMVGRWGEIPVLGPALSAAGSIIFVAGDTIVAALEGGRPQTEAEIRRAQKLVKDLVDLPEIFSKPWDIGTNIGDLIFGTDSNSFLKPSHWLDGAWKLMSGQSPLVGRAS